LVISEKHGLPAPFLFVQNSAKMKNKLMKREHSATDSLIFLRKGKIIQFQNISGNFLATFPLWRGGKGGSEILLTRFCAFLTGYTNMSSFTANSLLGSSHVTQYQNFEKNYWLPSPNSC
jgi:hypothetical protein